MKNISKSRAGQVIAIAVILLALSAVFIPLLTMLFRKESKDVVKYKADNSAYNAARLAMEKMEWRFSQDASLLHDAMVGTPRAGFQGETDQLDVDGVVYRVRLASASVDNSMVLNRGRTLVEVKAWPKNAPSHTKGIQAHFEGPLLKGPLWVGNSNDGTLSPGGMNQNAFHWGPLVSSRYNVATYNWRGYPRAFSGGSIQLFSTTSWTFTSTLNVTDNLSYWPNSAYYAQGYNEVSPDFNYYKAKSKASRFPSFSVGGTYDCVGTTSNMESPTDSGYCENEIQILNTSGGYEFRNSTSVLMGVPPNYNGHNISGVRFLDIEAIVLYGLNGVVSGPFALNGNVVQATIPVNANLEYQHPNGQAVWTAGSPSMSSVFQTSTRCCYPIQNAFLRGFVGLDKRGEGGMYFTFSGNMIGAILDNKFNPSIGASSTLSQIYYDPEIAEKAVLDGKLERKSWKEVNLTW